MQTTGLTPGPHAACISLQNAVQAATKRLKWRKETEPAFRNGITAKNAKRAKRTAAVGWQRGTNRGLPPCRIDLSFFEFFGFSAVNFGFRIESDSLCPAQEGFLRRVNNALCDEPLPKRPQTPREGTRLTRFRTKSCVCRPAALSGRGFERSSDILTFVPHIAAWPPRDFTPGFEPFVPFCGNSTAAFGFPPPAGQKVFENSEELFRKNPSVVGGMNICMSPRTGAEMRRRQRPPSGPCQGRGERVRPPSLSGSTETTTRQLN